MVRFLFWNICGNNIPTIIAKIVAEYQIDVVILTECKIKSLKLREALRLETGLNYFYSSATSECEKVEIFTNFPDKYIEKVLETHRLTIRVLSLPDMEEILLAVVHFPTKLFWEGIDQSFESTVLSRTIRDQERYSGHSRTLLVGDLNMNPYDPGVVASHGLHAIHSRDLVLKKKSRIVQDNDYPMFYNPMWNLLGDFSSNPPGTFFKQQSKPFEPFWHLIDQVLLRPDLVSNFVLEELRIIKSIDNYNFLTERGKLKKEISDHLPIYFELEL